MALHLPQHSIYNRNQIKTQKLGSRTFNMDQIRRIFIYSFVPFNWPKFSPLRSLPISFFQLILVAIDLSSTGSSNLEDKANTMQCSNNYQLALPNNLLQYQQNKSKINYEKDWRMEFFSYRKIQEIIILNQNESSEILELFYGMKIFHILAQRC